MSKKKLDHFCWYPADAETDAEFCAMSHAEVGFYLRCLNLAWLNDGIPADPVERALALRTQCDVHDQLWTRVKRCFTAHPSDPSRLINKRQQVEKAKAIKRSKMAIELADRRWKKRNAKADAKADAKAMPTYMPTQCEGTVSTQCDGSKTNSGHSIANALSQTKQTADMPTQCGGYAPASESNARASERNARELNLSYVLKKEEEESKTVESRSVSPRFLDRWQLDEQFVAFREKYLAIGAAVTEADWAEAFWQWKVLDFTQKQAAIEHVKTCDPAFIPLPKNYLRKHEWKRPARPEPKSKYEKMMAKVLESM